MDREQARRRLIQQHVEAGHITEDEHGVLHMADKGQKRVTKVLNRVPAEDCILLEIAVLEGRGIPATI